MDTANTAHLSPAMKRRIAEEAAAGQRRLKHHAGTRASTDQAVAAAKDAADKAAVPTWVAGMPATEAQFGKVLNPAPGIADHVAEAPLEVAPKPARKVRQAPVAEAPPEAPPADPIDSLLD